jgi:outer membrane protein TolC
MALLGLRIAVCLLLAASAAAYGEHAENAHEGPAHLLNMAADPDMTLADALLAATQRLRLRDWSEQRQSVADARLDMGDAWLGDAPSIGGSWRDYDWNNNSDLYEAEVYLLMPLWRLGERKATRAMAANDARLAPLQSLARQLESAAEVRSAYWRVLDSQTRYELLQQVLQTSERYAEQVQLRLDAGDVARTEFLQSQQQVLDFRGQLLDAKSQVIDSTRRWRFITGLNAIPAKGREQLAAIDAIDQQHPMLQLALAEVELTRSELEVSRNSGSLRPSVSLNLKRENIDDLAPPLDSVGIGVNIPLGRGKAHLVDVSQTEQRLLEAEVQLQTLHRQLQEDLHEIRHQAHVNEANLADSTALLEIAEQVYQSQELANQQGETSVIEVLRAAQALAEVHQRHSLLTLTRDALVSQQNQVLGVLPQ